MDYQNQQLGGFNASQKLYSCKCCGGLGSGNRFVAEHLARQCDGIQKRKTKASTKINESRRREAEINTELWHKQQAEAALLKDYKRAKASIMESVKIMQNEFSMDYQEALNTYYKQIF